MIINNSQQKNISYNQTFGGRLTARYSKAWLQSLDTLTQINKTYDNLSIIGTPPTEFIPKLKQGCKNKEEISKKIQEFYSIFDKAVRYLKTGEDWLYPEVDAMRAAITVLTLKLQKLGVLKKNQYVSIRPLGGGAYANAYELIFTNTEYSSKVLKVFRDTPTMDVNADIHGILPETNAAAFIKKARGHKADNFICPEFYFSNIKSNFMLFENADNYTTPVRSTEKRLALGNSDETKVNKVNYRQVDMGGFYSYPGMKEISQNSTQRRVLKQLLDAFSNCWITHCYQLEKRSTVSKIIDTMKRNFHIPRYREFNIDKYTQLYNKLYKNAINNKIPQSKDVLKALEIVREKITEPSNNPFHYRVGVPILDFGKTKK